MCASCGSDWLLAKDVRVGDMICLPKLPAVAMKVWSVHGTDGVTLESTDGMEFYENYDIRNFNRAGYIRYKEPA